MTWSALGRFGVDPAPAGLAFVQDFMDTISAGKPRQEDLLADRSTAQDWLDDALRSWAGLAGTARLGIDLAPEDLDQLRSFREDLRRTVTGPQDDAAHAADPPPTMLPTLAVGLHWDGAGRVQPLPRGSGWRKVASLVALEVFRAQLDGSWSRLKACRNPRCAVAFFDRSRNNSAVWHSVKVCGNAANLRAYRARQRATGGAGGGRGPPAPAPRAWPRRGWGGV
ncbi:CGNR zinc finger domain-containing protein [Kitasatospora sp. NPDC059571]|uniref:CGNR zinc finger domain-containing protein n=1 Tax=Kitasatospora sp. NPDC059571 TaxID=3346871 RepID=UPI0036C86202